MWFGILTLATALIISVSAAYYSILGLTAIFAAAFWPIVILGSSLEVGKIVSTLWLHKYWDRAELQYKVYLCSAVAILMLLTSMGVFGFLSKAHSDQSMVSGDVIAKISIYDEKIKQARDNIDMSRRALTQMDSAVDQTMSRSTNEQGADKAAQLRRSQAAERNRLLREIDAEQKKIQSLNDQRAPIAAEVRKVEAEVGPIKYIAALIYGDNPEANLLEKAVRWVIILIVIVFDPLALTLLLAATKTLEWERGINIMAPAVRRPDEPKDEEDPEVKEWFDRLREKTQAMDAGTYKAPEEPNPYQDVKPDEQHWYDQVEDEQPVAKETPRFRVLSGLDSMWNRSKERPVVDAEAEHAPIETPPQVKVESTIEDTTEDNDEHTEITHGESEEKKLEAICERAWKEENPGKTLKRERQLFRAGVIAELPWNNQEFRNRVLSPMNLSADNTLVATAGEVRGFGTAFPVAPVKGDMFLRVDRLPTALFKFNGVNWIEVDKNLSDNYAYDNAYIDHLIEKIDTGEYDPELLSDSERDHIAERLNSTLRKS
jgi:hypothetical protein